jgi:hypothetical protein
LADTVGETARAELAKSKPRKAAKPSGTRKARNRRAAAEVIDDPHYSTPLYHKAEAAHIIAVPAQTFRNWAVGYARKRLDGSHVVSAPIVTTLEPARPQGVSVPFIGLAEAYIVAAFTKAGLPMQRIRPAVLWLQDHIGLPQALASQRLQTDGAEVLWDFGRQSGDPAD